MQSFKCVSLILTDVSSWVEVMVSMFLSSGYIYDVFFVSFIVVVFWSDIIRVKLQVIMHRKMAYRDLSLQNTDPETDMFNHTPCLNNAPGKR